MSQRREGREALSFVVPRHSFDALSARRHAPKEQRRQLEGLGSVYTDVPLGERNARAKVELLLPGRQNSNIL